MTLRAGESGGMHPPGGRGDKDFPFMGFCRGLLFFAGAFAASVAVFAADAAALPPLPTTGYREAPELAARVARGELPPVAERLPGDPKVVTPCDEVGVYGGMWRRAHLGPSDTYGMTYILKETLVSYSRDYGRIVPNLCSAYEISADKRTFTFHLRRGMRWSDGAPFTADDYLFWYNDHLLFREMNPTVPMWFRRAGEVMKMVKVDAYTIELRFKEPYAAFLDYLAGEWNPTLYAPAHHCKRFHPRHAGKEELDRIVREGGYTNWQDMYRRKTWYVDSPDTPTMHAWNVENRASEPIWRWKRNPYYWKVDTAGNQLPYLDGIQVRLMSHPEAILLSARAGEIDMQMRRIGGINVVGIENYPFLMEYRERGGYRVILLDTFRQNKFCILMNFTHRDPVLRALFNDLRFRMALSHGMDREEINAFCMDGLGFPCQVLPNPKSRWFDPEAAKMYIEHDPAKSNRLLDEIGLRWDAAHEWRQRRAVRATGESKNSQAVLEEDPSGRMTPLSVNLLSAAASIPAMDLVREQWAKLGIKLTITPVIEQYLATAVRSGNYDLTVDSINTAWDGCFFHVLTAPPYYSTNAAPEWGRWVSSRGRIGQEPPAWFRSLIDQSEAILTMPAGADRVAAIQAMQMDSIRNLLRIGGLASPPEATFAVVRNDFRNVPDPIPNFTSCDPAIFYKRAGGK